MIAGIVRYPPHLLVRTGPCRHRLLRYRPELLEQPQRIETRPVFHDLAIRKTVDLDAAHSNPFPRRRNVMVRTAMRPPARPTDDHPVTFRDLILNCVDEVG